MPKTIFVTRTEARTQIHPEALARDMRRIVLDDQRDLVVRERRLEPIAVLKG